MERGEKNRLPNYYSWLHFNTFKLSEVEGELEMADVEEVALPPPQTDQEEEEASVNQKMEKNKSEGEDSTENKSTDNENDNIKGEDSEKVVDSENNEEKQVRNT